jgi:hypothetical protein
VTFEVVFESPASQEVKVAFEWYESRKSGLGSEFLRSVALARDLLVSDPKRFSVTRVPFHWVKLRKFPYSLHYRIVDKQVTVLACLLFRQSPERWPGA